MPVTDTWSDWDSTAASNTPLGSATPEIDDELRNIKAQCKGNLVETGVTAQTIGGTKTFSTNPVLSAMTAAGFVKNTTAGVLSGGNSIATGDIPTGINSTCIADGSITNTEFQYLNGVTAALQTQIDGKAGTGDVGIVRQRVSTFVTDASTATTVIPWDTSVPQISEGTELVALAITAASTGNILSINNHIQFSVNGATQVIAAIFKDSDTNAIGAAAWNVASAAVYYESFHA